MGIAFGTAATVFRNFSCRDYRGTYNHITMADIERGRPKVFPVYGNRFAQISTAQFTKIPGSPIAYWASESVIKAYGTGVNIGTLGETRQGMASSDDGRFVRMWYEVNRQKIGFGLCSAELAKASRKKWFPYNKGGNYRKWYGNNTHIVNYENDGFEVKEYASKLYKSASRNSLIKFKALSYFFSLK